MPFRVSDKAAVKRVQSQMYLNYAEREQVRCRNSFVTAKVQHSERPLTTFDDFHY